MDRTLLMERRVASSWMNQDVLPMAVSVVVSGHASLFSIGCLHVSIVISTLVQMNRDSALYCIGFICHPSAMGRSRCLLLSACMITSNVTTWNAFCKETTQVCHVACQSAKTPHRPSATRPPTLAPNITGRGDSGQVPTHLVAC